MSFDHLPGEIVREIVRINMLTPDTRLISSCGRTAVYSTEFAKLNLIAVRLQVLPFCLEIRVKGSAEFIKIHSRNVGTIFRNIGLLRTLIISNSDLSVALGILANLAIDVSMSLRVVLSNCKLSIISLAQMTGMFRVNSLVRFVTAFNLLVVDRIYFENCNFPFFLLWNSREHVIAATLFSNCIYHLDDMQVLWSAEEIECTSSQKYLTTKAPSQSYSGSTIYYVAKPKKVNAIIMKGP